MSSSSTSSSIAPTSSSALKLEAFIDPVDQILAEGKELRSRILAKDSAYVKELLQDTSSLSKSYSHLHRLIQQNDMSAEPGAKDSAFTLACRLNRAKILNYFITFYIKKNGKPGSILDTATSEGITGLQAASQSGSFDCVSLLLSSGADPNYIPPISLSHPPLPAPLLLACQGGHAPIVSSLLSAGADITVSLPGGWTPLFVAAFFGSSACVREVLLPRALVASDLAPDLVFYAKSESPDARMADGATALFLACQEGHHGVVYYLLNGAKADPHIRQTETGHTPLYIACQNGHAKCVELLLQSGVRPLDDEEPLFAASQFGHLQVVRHLLSAGLDANRPGDQGATPLYISCAEGHEEVAEALLEGGGDWTASLAVDDGMTAQWAAAKMKHGGCVEVLRKHFRRLRDDKIKREKEKEREIDEKQRVEKEVEELRRTVDGLEKAKVEREKEVEELRQAVDELEKAKVEREKEVKELRRAADVLENAKNETEMQLASVQATGKEMTAQFLQASQELETMAATAIKFRQDIQDLNDQVTEEKASKVRETSDLRRVAKGFEEERDGLVEENGRLLKEIDRFAEEVKRLEREVQRLKDVSEEVAVFDVDEGREEKRPRRELVTSTNSSSVSIPSRAPKSAIAVMHQSMTECAGRVVEIKQEAQEAEKRAQTAERRAQTAERRAEDAEDGLLCVLCMTEPRGILYHPCNHFSFCATCDETLKKKHAECPTCRTKIKTRFKAFLS